MRLTKSKSYRRKGKDYFAWRVNLPTEHVEALGWQHGQELEAVARKGGILIRPAEADASGDE